MGKTKGLILCVEDDTDTREMLRALLSLEGYEVTATGSISDSLPLAKVHDFDLIVLDWKLRDGTGVDLCVALRGAGVTASVLFCTGMDITKELLDQATRAGAQGFLTKPVDANSILQKVSELIGQRKPD